MNQNKLKLNSNFKSCNISGINRFKSLKSFSFKTMSTSSKYSNIFSVSSMYNTRVQNMFILSRTESFSLSGLKYFISSLLMSYSIDTRKGAIVNSFTNLVVLYIAFFSFMNTSSISYLVQSQKQFLFPKFIIDVIDKISLYVRNTSRFTSLTECVTISTNFRDIKVYIQSLIQEKDLVTLKSILNETKFSSITEDSRLLQDLVSRIQNKLIPLLSQESENDFFSEISDIIPLCVNETFSGSARQMTLFNVRFKQITTPHLGIFRFRNSPIDGQFYVSADGLSRLETKLRDYFCAILIVSNPRFEIGENKDNLSYSVSIREGDLPIDVNGIDKTLAWSLILSGEVINSGGSSTYSGSSTNTDTPVSRNNMEQPRASIYDTTNGTGRSKSLRSVPDSGNYSSTSNRLGSLASEWFNSYSSREDTPNVRLFEQAVLNCLFKYLLHEIRVLEEQKL